MITINISNLNSPVKVIDFQNRLKYKVKLYADYKTYA